MATTPADNYTQMPNALLELMASGEMGLAEMRVTLAILRETKGWHREEIELSYGQFETMTGLGRPSIAEGLKAGMQRGTIERTPYGQGFVYRVVVKQLNQLSSFTSEATSPEVVKQLNQNQLSSLTNNKEERKNLKKEKENKARSRKSAPRADTEEQETKLAKERKRDLVFEAMAEVCGVDWHVCTDEQRLQLNQTLTIIRRSVEKQQQTEQDIISAIRYVAKYHEKHHYRGQKGLLPTPASLREIWGAAIKARASPPTGPPVSPYAPDARPATQRMKAILMNNGAIHEPGTTE